MSLIFPHHRGLAQYCQGKRPESSATSASHILVGQICTSKRVPHPQRVTHPIKSDHKLGCVAFYACAYGTRTSQLVGGFLHIMTTLNATPTYYTIPLSYRLKIDQE